MIGHDTYPRQFFKTLSGEITREITDRGAYCNNFNCFSLTLAGGVGPGARRAIRRPSMRSSPGTNSAVPTGRPVLSARRRAAKASSLSSRSQVREARRAIEHWTDGHQPIILPAR